jgi:hypothetical protein
MNGKRPLLRIAGLAIILFGVCTGWTSCGSDYVSDSNIKLPAVSGEDVTNYAMARHIDWAEAKKHFAGLGYSISGSPTHRWNSLTEKVELIPPAPKAVPAKSVEVENALPDQIYVKSFSTNDGLLSSSCEIVFEYAGTTYAASANSSVVSVEDCTKFKPDEAYFVRWGKDMRTATIYKLRQTPKSSTSDESTFEELGDFRVNGWKRR